MKGDMRLFRAIASEIDQYMLDGTEIMCRADSEREIKEARRIFLGVKSRFKNLQAIVGSVDDDEFKQVLGARLKAAFDCIAKAMLQTLEDLRVQ